MSVGNAFHTAVPYDFMVKRRVLEWALTGRYAVEFLVKYV